MITGIRKLIESAKEDVESKTKKLSDSINKQYLEKQQKAAADAAKKALADAQKEAGRLSAAASTATDSAIQQLQGKLDALAAK